MIEYLDDDGSELALERGKFRRRLGSYVPFKVLAVNKAIWSETNQIDQHHQPPVWDTLLLDSYAALPEIGPAIVLAYTAVETASAQVLNRLAQLKSITPQLWAWITDRGGPVAYMKNPSTSDELDTLALILGGQSLKSEPTLWEAFRNLGSARNSFVHEGTPKIGDDVVSTNRASELVQRADAILTWLERLLPANERRPRLSTRPTITVAHVVE